MPIVSIQLQVAKSIRGPYWLAEPSQSPLIPLYEREEPERITGSYPLFLKRRRGDLPTSCPTKLNDYCGRRNLVDKRVSGGLLFTA